MDAVHLLNQRGGAGAQGGLRLRHARVLIFFARIFLTALVWDVGLRRVGLSRWARRTSGARYRAWARRYRGLAAQLGGVWIKVGQFLSARVDVLPDSVTAELAGLQDEVAPESVERLLPVIESELGRPVHVAFADFERQPLASASLGQVHRARLGDGSAVVVKVQRPGIEGVLTVDLAALRTVIGWLKRFRPIARRADLEALFQEFSRTLWDEIDYVKEADNARRFAVLFADQPDVRVPRVHDGTSTRRVLTLEDVYFIKITDYAAIEAAGVSRKEVAARLFRTYMHQIFEVGFFHADPHPGNLFVEPANGPSANAGANGPSADAGANGPGAIAGASDGSRKGWRLVFVDFGMVGRLAPEARSGLRNLAIALGTRDVDRLMRAYGELGVLLPGADLDRLRQAEAAVFERLWGKSVRELMQMDPREMRRFAHEFRDLLYEMPFQMPSDLIFLGRCVAILSGMCTGLDPDFNLFSELAPFARTMLTAEGGGMTVDSALTWAIEQVRVLAGLPGRLDGLLSRVERGELTVVARAAPELQRQLERMTTAINRLVVAVLLAALIVAVILLAVRP